MLSNKLTFSLASLVILLALGLVFATAPVMAHDTGDTAHVPADPPTDHEHPTLTITVHAVKTVKNAADADYEIPGDELSEVVRGTDFMLKFVSSIRSSAAPAGLSISAADKDSYAVASPGLIAATPAAITSVVDSADVASQTEYSAKITWPTGTEADEVTQLRFMIPAGSTGGITSLATLNQDAGFLLTESVRSAVIPVLSTARVQPDIVEITSTAKGHDGNAILVKFTVTRGTTGSGPATLDSDDIDVTNGYLVTDSFRDVTPTGANAPADGSVTWQGSVVPDPGSTAALMVGLKTASTGFALKAMADGSAGTALSVPHTAPTPTPDTGPPPAADLEANEIPAHGYAVVLHTGATRADAGIAADVQVINRDLSDLYEFFRDGGTIDLKGPSSATAGSLKISEIMWGRDDALSTPKNSQWIELRNLTAASITFGATWSFDFVPGLSAATVVDRVGNLGDPGRWDVKGQGGRTVASTDEAAVELISMYRKLKQLSDTAHADYGKNDGDPQASGAWVASARPSRNLAGERVGTPGAIPSEQIASGATAIDRSTVYITEIGNSLTDSLDWIELYNSTDAAVNIKDWIISAITYADVMDATGAELQAASANNSTLDKQLVRIARATYEDALNIPAKSYLLIAASDPTDAANPLSGGINLKELKPDRDANTNETQGLVSLYYVDTGLKIPNGAHLLILRNNHEKEGQAANIRDIVTVGNKFKAARVPGKWNTNVWPLQATGTPGDLEVEATLTAGDAPYVMTKRGGVGDHNKAHWAHKDTWAIAGAPGVGYDREHTGMAGTPGYDNGAIKGNDKDFADDTVITISEIMIDSGRNLPQWIELYNASMTQAVNVENWRLEIYNYASEDVANNELINVNITLPKTLIQPNQTVLIVSTKVGRHSGHFPDERIIDLYDPGNDPFGRANRRDPVLSATGFNLSLYDNDSPRKLIDQVGNIDDNRRNADEPAWDLPMSSDDRRSSLVRRYDGGEARVGTTSRAWILASATELAFAHNADTFYGNPDDEGTPGFRGGGPLPVSLSSFRPMRDKATGEVVIRWITQSELNNAGFNILRSESKYSDFKVVNVKGIIPGHGTTSEKHVYTWTDTSAKPNVVYYYQIEDVSLDGDRTTLATTHLRGNVNAAGKLTTRWGELKTYGK